MQSRFYSAPLVLNVKLRDNPINFHHFGFIFLNTLSSEKTGRRERPEVQYDKTRVHSRRLASCVMELHA